MSRPTGGSSPGRAIPEFDRLLLNLTEQIEREALAEARRTLVTLLCLRPKDPTVLEAQAFLESQAAAAETEPLHRLIGHETWVNSTAFAADNKTAFTASGGEFGEHGFTDGPDCTIRAWSVDKGSAVKTFSGHSSLINSIVVLPPKGHIVSGTRGGSIALWDLNVEQRAVRTFQRSEGAAVLCLARSPDGSRFLSGSEDRFLRLWDVHSAQRLRKCAGHTQPVTSAAFFPDGRQALSGSQDQTLRLWNLDSGQEMRKFTGHTMAVMTVAVSADGKRFLSAGGDGIRLWDTLTGSEVRRFEGHSNVVNSVTFTPNGRFIVSGSADKTIRLWDVETGHELCCFAGHGDTVRSIAVSPDGRFLLSSSNDKTACVWSLPV
jgi:WD40 repeat protein